MYKILALAGINTEDLEKESTMELIKDVLTDFIIDDDMNEEDIDFTAR